MSDLDKLEKKYEKGSKTKEIRGSISKLKETPSNPDTKRAFESRKETLESMIRAAKQATAGFKSQWSGLDEEGKVGMGKGTPGIYYNTAALPALAGVVDEKYAPDFAVEADKKAGKIKEAVRKDMGINEPRGPLEHFSYAGGEMIGQIPVPGAWMNKIVSGAKKMGMAGKVAAAPIEYLSPTVDPRALNYGIGTAFGGTLGTALEDEPTKKALGGLIQKYENGGKVGKVKSFFSAVDKAIDTLKQKKGTGEQILKQLEATPGVKQEELETRGIKQKLQASPKITQEELQKMARRNKPAIPKRIVLGGGIDPAWQPKLEKHLQEALEELNIQPVVDPATGKNFGFMHPETGDILSQKEIRALSPEELGLPVNPDSGKLDDPGSRRIYMNVRQAVDEANQQFTNALDRTNTKFGPYSRSKGNDNYREVLLQHENAEPSNAPALNARLEELLNSQPETEEAAQAINEEINQVIDKLSTRRPFTDTHWTDPDIFAHYRVSDMTGPNGEKVLYVDEVQSDWHQKARDARKTQIKNKLDEEKQVIHKQAVEQLRSETGNVVLNQDNMNRLQKIKNTLTKERKVQLENEIDENAGYRSTEDDEKLDQLNKKMQRLRDTGLTMEEIKEYYTPGKIIGDSSGYDRVLSFNEGSKNPRYQEVYDSRFQQAMNAGVGPEVAANFARRRADEDLKHDWSVTVVQVDPSTGEPLKNGYGPRTHQTSPEDEVRRELQNEAQAIEIKKPDAPFKKNWHELAVRDILDLAAKEGYDKVAFSPGIEQVKRYSDSLRQAVDEIQFAPTADGQVVVTGIKGGSEIFNGTVLGDTFVSGPQKAIGKTLEEVFGGKIGKQIEEQAQMPGAGVGKISGEDLTIGGEGMKSFYDQRLPSYVKEYGKKEFKAPTGYMEVKGSVRGKSWTPQEFRDEMIELDDGSMELMEMAHEIAHTRAEEALTRRGITREGISSDDWDEALWDEMDNHADAAHEQALRTLAQRSMSAKAGKENTLRAFSIDVTPEMKEKITTQGQRLHGFVAPQILPPLAAGAAGAEYIRQSVQQPPAEQQEPPQEQVQEPPEEPQAFDKGGKVGKVKEVFSLIGSKIRSGQPIEVEVFHGSPTTGIEKFKKSPPAASKGLADSKAGAFWGTANREQAKEYALGKTMENQFPSKEKGSEQGEVYDILASLKNPLVLWDDNYLPWDKNHAASVDSPYTRKFALEYAKKNGHDGVVFANKSGKKREVSSFEVAILPDEQGEYPGVIKKDRQEPPEEPQGFQKGGKVGNMKEAAESLLRVLHGSPTKVRLDKEKNLDVTTDESYAMKRARDKMDMFGQAGPPMLNKFDVPAAKMLRFEETYSPADVALMRRFFNRLPEGKAMTGEEIYDIAGGKDFVMEGIAKAGGMAGYERPAGGSGGVGNWYRVTDQEALTRKARGGFVEGYADGGIKGGKVDLARRGILGLSRLFEEPAQTANLPAVIPTTPVAKPPDVVAPLTQLMQKTAETPMSRRDVLKKAGNVAISQAAKGVVPMALKEAVLEAIPIKVSPVGNVENAVKNLYIDQMFENFYDDAAGHGGTLFDAYESFLPFISQSLSKSEKKAIEKARDLFYEYGEDEIPSRVYDRISKGVDILQEKIAEKGNDIPIKDVLSPDMYKMSLEDMKDYGIEITPDMVEQLRKTEWAPDVFHEFDTP
jgi:uncharacterized protein YidB (DUF937 family)